MTLFKQRVQVGYALDERRDHLFENMEMLDLVAAEIIQEIWMPNRQFWGLLARHGYCSKSVIFLK